jgi:hypothetical protein
MFGPGLALRGKDGAESMNIAVDCLKDESKGCFKFFVFMLLSFHISSFLLMWIKYKFFVALSVNIVLFIFLTIFIKNGAEIAEKLHVEDN